MFSIIQLLFLQKTKHLNPHHFYLGLEFESGPQRIRDLAFVCLLSVGCAMCPKNCRDPKRVNFPTFLLSDYNS
jgi:hypothetical protein